jgi:histidine ammonia-lyase
MARVELAIVDADDVVISHDVVVALCTVAQPSREMHLDTHLVTLRHYRTELLICSLMFEL